MIFFLSFCFSHFYPNSVTFDNVLTHTCMCQGRQLPNVQILHKCLNWWYLISRYMPLLSSHGSSKNILNLPNEYWQSRRLGFLSAFKYGRLTLRSEVIKKLVFLRWKGFGTSTADLLDFPTSKLGKLSGSPLGVTLLSRKVLSYLLTLTQ